MTSEDIRGIGLPPEAAIRHFLGKTRIPTDHWSDVWGAANAHGFMVAGAGTDALLADFQEEIHKAYDIGTTLADFRKAFDGMVERHGWVHNGKPGWRAQIIYETNLATALSAGQYEALSKPTVLTAYPYWQYVHSGSRHPRLQHLAWNGLVLRADDPWWSTHYPPNGWNCGCRVRPMSGRGLARQGKAGPDEAPNEGSRPWRNPKTGEVHQVPTGIDPGWDYNVGEAWLGAKPAVPAQAKWALRVPPAPPAPPIPAAAAVEATKPAATEAPIEFASAPEADDHLTRAYVDWAKSLSTEEEDAIHLYKRSPGFEMNREMRGLHTGEPEFTVDNANLVAALGRAEVPEALRVWRGLSDEFAERLTALKPGDEIQEAGFTSTTIDPAIADKFRAMYTPKNKVTPSTGAVLEFVVPKGYRGAAYINNVPDSYVAEYEMLFHPGLKLRVVEIVGNTVRAEILP